MAGVIATLSSGISIGVGANSLIHVVAKQQQNVARFRQATARGHCQQQNRASYPWKSANLKHEYYGIRNAAGD